MQSYISASPSQLYCSNCSKLRPVKSFSDVVLLTDTTPDTVITAMSNCTRYWNIDIKHLIVHAPLSRFYIYITFVLFKMIFKVPLLCYKPYFFLPQGVFRIINNLMLNVIFSKSIFHTVHSNVFVAWKTSVFSIVISIIWLNT